MPGDGGGYGGLLGGFISAPLPGSQWQAGPMHAGNAASPAVGGAAWMHAHCGGAAAGAAAGRVLSAPLFLLAAAGGVAAGAVPADQDTQLLASPGGSAMQYVHYYPTLSLQDSANGLLVQHRAFEQAQQQQQQQAFEQAHAMSLHQAMLQQQQGLLAGAAPGGGAAWSAPVMPVHPDVQTGPAGWGSGAGGAGAATAGYAAATQAAERLWAPLSAPLAQSSVGGGGGGDGGAAGSCMEGHPNRLGNRQWRSPIWEGLDWNL